MKGNKPVTLVTGANGQLGITIRNLSDLYPEFDFRFYTRVELPIDNELTVKTIFDNIKPFACINCAAYTAVDAAETDRENAFLANASGAATLARCCKALNVRFIHVSTDYVFDGKSQIPYKEDVAVNPLNVYGASKAKGETLVVEHYPDAIIVRTSWVYSEYGKNFVKTMIRLMESKPEIKVVNDQIGSPTYATDLAKAIMTIVKSGSPQPGIYHYCNTGIISWFDFAVEIGKKIGSQCRIFPIPGSAYPAPAARPAYGALDTKKIASQFHLQIPEWKESLKICLQNLEQSKLL